MEGVGEEISCISSRPDLVTLSLLFRLSMSVQSSVAGPSQLLISYTFEWICSTAVFHCELFACILGLLK